MNKGKHSRAPACDFCGSEVSSGKWHRRTNGGIKKGGFENITICWICYQQDSRAMHGKGGRRLNSSDFKADVARYSIAQGIAAPVGEQVVTEEKHGGTEAEQHMAAGLPQQSLVDAALSMPPTYSNKRKAVMGPSFTLPTSQSSQGLIDDEQRQQLADHLQTKNNKVYGGYQLSSSGKLQVAAQPYQRQRSLKSILRERLQQGLTTDPKSLEKAAGWSSKGV